MKIESIEKIEVNYPEMDEISEERIKTSIPRVWLKLGITAFLIDIVMKKRVFAIEEQLIPTAGVMPYYKPEYNPIYDQLIFGCNIVTIVSLITFLVSVFIMIFAKSKAKKQGNKYRASKKLKIIFILSTVLAILGIIGTFVISYLK